MDYMNLRTGDSVLFYKSSWANSKRWFNKGNVVDILPNLKRVMVACASESSEPNIIDVKPKEIIGKLSLEGDILEFAPDCGPVVLVDPLDSILPEIKPGQRRRFKESIGFFTVVKPIYNPMKSLWAINIEDGEQEIQTEGYLLFKTEPVGRLSPEY